MCSTNGFASQQTKIACSTLLIGVGLVYAVKKFIDSRSPKPSGNWKEVGEVTELRVYPIKSCKGISLDVGKATSIGMETPPVPGCMSLGDRRLVVYKHPAMDMVSARTYYQMLQIQIEPVSAEHIVIKYRENEIKVQLPNVKPDSKIKLWSENVALVDCGDEVAEWLQRVVYGKEGFRLGYYPDPNTRRNIPHIVKDYKEFYPFMRNEYTGAFSDLSPFLLLNESSVADLNSRIKERLDSSTDNTNDQTSSTVTCTNFRGNIIVKGPQPYEEDSWKWVKIGNELVFQNFKLCTRCSLTTVNPESSEKDKNMEPIATLKTYRMMMNEKLRKLDQSPAMGIYLGLWTDSGNVRVGDRVYVCD